MKPHGPDLSLRSTLFTTVLAAVLAACGGSTTDGDPAAESGGSDDGAGTAAHDDAPEDASGGDGSTSGGDEGSTGAPDTGAEDTTGEETGGSDTGGGGIDVGVDFPLGWSHTVGATVRVRGHGAGDGLEGVLVAGEPAQSDDGFAVWTAEVPVQYGENSLTVEAIVDGEVVEVDTLEVLREDLLRSPVAVAATDDGTRVFIADDELGLFELDTATGRRELVSEASMSSNVEIAYDPTMDRVILVDPLLDTLSAIDLSDGSTDPIAVIPGGQAHTLSLDTMTQRAFVSRSGDVPIVFDLLTGEVVDFAPAAPLVNNSTAAVDPLHRRLVVLQGTQWLLIDLDNGSHETLDVPLLGGYNAFTVDPSGEAAYVFRAYGDNIVRRIDLTTGQWGTWLNTSDVSRLADFRGFAAGPEGLLVLTEAPGPFPWEKALSQADWSDRAVDVLSSNRYPDPAWDGCLVNSAAHSQDELFLMCSVAADLTRIDLATGVLDTFERPEWAGWSWSLAHDPDNDELLVAMDGSSGTDFTGVARFNPAAGSWDPWLERTVTGSTRMTVDPETQEFAISVGGNFPSVASYDLSTGAVTNGFNSVDNEVGAMAMDPTSLYLRVASGNFINRVDRNTGSMSVVLPAGALPEGDVVYWMQLDAPRDRLVITTDDSRLAAVNLTTGALDILAEPDTIDPFGTDHFNSAIGLGRFQVLTERNVALVFQDYRVIATDLVTGESVSVRR